jgi:hypothetical protein
MIQWDRTSAAELSILERFDAAQRPDHYNAVRIGVAFAFPLAEA